MTTRRQIRAVEPATAPDATTALLEFLPQRVRNGYARMTGLLDANGLPRGEEHAGLLFLTLEADQVIPFPDERERGLPAC
jgi:hypothetical protein